MANRDRVLVVGGGFIGTAAARALASCGHSVSVLTRAPASLLLGDINWIYGSLDYPHLTDLLEGVGAVICANGTIAPGTKLDSVAAALSHDLIPVVRFAERAAESGVSRLIFISSGGTVYGQTAPMPTPETARNEYQLEFFRRLRYADQHFQGFGPGWRSDMGRIYIHYGPPDQIEQRAATAASPQYELWYYNQPYRRFVFADREGFGRFSLISPSIE